MSEECGCGGIIPKVWKYQLPDEVFVIVLNRADDTQPKACKTMDSRWFHTLEDAQEFLARLKTFPLDASEFYGIYRTHITILDRIKGE